jgi:hypothetical protein
MRTNVQRLEAAGELEEEILNRKHCVECFESPSVTLDSAVEYMQSQGVTAWLRSLKMGLI